MGTNTHSYKLRLWSASKLCRTWYNHHQSYIFQVLRRNIKHLTTILYGHPKVTVLRRPFSFFTVNLKGYTGRHFAGWCRRVGWDAAWRWPAEIPPASSAGSPRAARSHSRGRQTPCSAGGREGDTQGSDDVTRRCGAAARSSSPPVNRRLWSGWSDNLVSYGWDRIQIYTFASMRRRVLIV